MNNYKKLETRINIGTKKEKERRKYKKRTKWNKEYNKELKELYAMKDEIEKVNNKLNSFFLNDSPTSNEVEEEYDNYESWDMK